MLKKLIWLLETIIFFFGRDGQIFEESCVNFKIIDIERNILHESLTQYNLEI